MSFLSQTKKCDYGSDFSDRESEAGYEDQAITRKKDNLFFKPSNDKLGLFNSSAGSSFKKPPSKRNLDAELDKHEGKRMRYHGILAMDAYSRHRKFVNDYLTYYGGKREDFKRPSQTYVKDKDVIKNNNKFIWDEEDSAKLNWEKKLAKKYWDKLFKEYAIADLRYFKENKIALRWRIEKEVVNGKGQFFCGNKHCNENDGLRSWEVNFAYMENDEKKNALVKLRLCPECSYKLNYHHKKREVKRIKVQKELKKSRKSKKKSKHELSSVVDIPSSSNIKVDKNKSSNSEDIWSQPLKVDVEKTREEEFDKYFNDMFE